MTVDMKSLARLGAQARIAELAAEMDAILTAFPDVSANAGRTVVQEHAPTETVAPQRKRRRYHHMTAAERKAVSVRMKKYWSERRKAQER